jgi:hypothetical protein
MELIVDSAFVYYILCFALVVEYRQLQIVVTDSLLDSGSGQI